MGLLNTVPNVGKSTLRISADELVPRNAKHQIVPDGSVITEPLFFDGAGIRNFDAVTPDSPSVKIEIDHIETDFYKVTFNLRTQKITSIFDKETGTELIDKDADFELGQFIYLYTEDKQKPEGSYEIPSKTEFSVWEGDIAYAIVQKGYEEQSGADITAQFIFYKNEKNIDVDLSYEHATGLIGDFNDRYKKNYFFAFPFKIEEPKFYSEMPIGELCENSDRIELNISDFTTVQNYLVAEGDSSGVALFTRDMPIFHIGKIKYNRFIKEFKEDKAHLYLYASSNRSNNLLYKDISECNAKYHLSILPYSGKHNEKVPSWSNRKEHKLTPIKATDKEIDIIRLDNENVKLVSMKKAENGENAIILRFAETAGKATKATAEIFFAPKKAVIACLLEKDVEEIKTNGNKLAFEIGAYTYATLKLYF